MHNTSVRHQQSPNTWTHMQQPCSRAQSVIVHAHTLVQSHTHVRSDSHAKGLGQMCSATHTDTHLNYTQMHPNGLLYISVFSSGSPCSPVQSNPTAVCPAASQPASDALHWSRLRSGSSPPPHHRKIPLCTPDASAGADLPTTACRCLVRVGDQRQHCWSAAGSFKQQCVRRLVNAELSSAANTICWLHSFYCMCSSWMGLTHRPLTHHHIVPCAALMAGFKIF